MKADPRVPPETEKSGAAGCWAREPGLACVLPSPREGEDRQESISQELEGEPFGMSEHVWKGAGQCWGRAGHTHSAPGMGVGSNPKATDSKTHWLDLGRKEGFWPKQLIGCWCGCRGDRPEKDLI